MKNYVPLFYMDVISVSERDYWFKRIYRLTSIDLPSIRPNATYHSTYSKCSWYLLQEWECYVMNFFHKSEISIISDTKSPAKCDYISYHVISLSPNQATINSAMNLLTVDPLCYYYAVPSMNRDLSIYSVSQSIKSADLNEQQYVKQYT